MFPFWYRDYGAHFLNFLCLKRYLNSEDDAFNNFLQHLILLSYYTLYFRFFNKFFVFEERYLKILTFPMFESLI